MIQDAAYQSLLRSTRQQAHQHIAQVLAQQFPHIVETQPELLAHHYTEADLHEQAVDAWQRAVERSAQREEVVCFERALNALQALPECPERIELAIELHLRLRNALLHLGEHEQIIEHLSAAERLAESLEDQIWLGKVSSFMTNYFTNVGDLDRALIFGQRTLTIAQAAEDFPLQVVANNHLGGLYLALGDYRQAKKVLGKNVESLSRAHDQTFFGLAAPPSILSRYMLVHCHSELGAFADGITCGEEAVRIAEEANRPLDRVYAYWGTSYLYLRQGALSRAIPLLECGIALCKDGSIDNFFPRFASLLGLAYALSGRSDEALPWLKQVIDPVVLSKARQSAFFFLYAGKAYALVGRIDDANALAERALTLAQSGKERGYEAWTLRLLGDIAIRHDAPEVEEAETYYRQALALANELGMCPLQAHCHHGLGTLYSQSGQSEQAQAELSTAIDMYRDMEMTFWLSEAEAALAQLT